MRHRAKCICRNVINPASSRANLKDSLLQIHQKPAKSGIFMSTLKQNRLKSLSFKTYASLLDVQYLFPSCIKVKRTKLKCASKLIYAQNITEFTVCNNLSDSIQPRNKDNNSLHTGILVIMVLLSMHSDNQINEVQQKFLTWTEPRTQTVE